MARVSFSSPLYPRNSVCRSLNKKKGGDKLNTIYLQQRSVRFNFHKKKQLWGNVNGFGNLCVIWKDRS